MSEERKSVSISGAGNIAGGSYSRVSISGAGKVSGDLCPRRIWTVSYTHLTLPTILLV